MKYLVNIGENDDMECVVVEDGREILDFLQEEGFTVLAIGCDVETHGVRNTSMRALARLRKPSTPSKKPTIKWAAEHFKEWKEFKKKNDSTGMLFGIDWDECVTPNAHYRHLITEWRYQRNLIKDWRERWSPFLL